MEPRLKATHSEEVGLVPKPDQSIPNIMSGTFLHRIGWNVLLTMACCNIGGLHQEEYIGMFLKTPVCMHLVYVSDTVPSNITWDAFLSSV